MGVTLGGGLSGARGLLRVRRARGVGVVVALVVGLALASTRTRFVLLVALGLALSLVADWAGLDSEHCEDECYGDLVRLANLAGWGVGLAVAGVLRWAYGRRFS